MREKGVWVIVTSQIQMSDKLYLLKRFILEKATLSPQLFPQL